MRFVFAIIATVIAAAMIVLGIGQRTVWAPPESLTAETALESGAPYAVIDGSTLDANPGRQTITVEGDGDLVLAYARTTDVMGWVGGSEYDEIGYRSEPEPAALTASQDTGTALDLSADVATADAAVTDPRGSDLWLEQFEGAGSITVALDVPDDVSILIASDGTAPAASDVRVSWPVDTATPLAGPLLLGGAVFLLIGIALYIWAFLHLRRQHGPRRKGPQGKIPRGARRPRARAGIQASVAAPRPARRRGLLVLPAVVGASLLLSGCSSDYWPDLAAGATVTPTASETSTAEPAAEVATPVVTTQQAEAIIASIADVASAADAAHDATALAERFQGEALTERTTNYEVVVKGGTIDPPQTIPASPVSLVLPQDTESWPRLVTAVVQNSADSTQAPIALVMSQASPRVDYKVDYAISLEANARIPDVAPVTVGTSIVAPDSKLMKLAPEEVGSAYADILANGDASQYAETFSADGDTLRGQVGIDKKNADREALPDTASIEFSNKAGTSSTIALATNDSGALVAASIAEVSTVRPTAEGSTVSTSGASQTLLGTDKSTTGIETTYGYQLLFYVPPVGSEEKIVMLGWSQGLVSVVQLP